jgi:hypothetical protein
VVFTMGYLVYRCEECVRFLLSDGGSFLAHKKMKHRMPGYGESRVVAIIESREKKYEFRDTPQEHREKWIKDNGMLKHVKLKGLDTEVYVIS